MQCRRALQLVDAHQTALRKIAGSRRCTGQRKRLVRARPGETAAMCPTSPSIHPSIHPSLPLSRLPVRLFVRSVSFAPRTPLDLVLCNARAVPFLTSSPSLFLSPTPLFTADSIPRARSPLSRARISSFPLCALLPLSPSADHHRHERRRFNLESTAKLLREQDMVTGKVEKEEGEGEAVEG